MRVFHWENFAALTRQISPDQRRAASIAAVTHALHDGYTDLIYIMLPLWQAEFGLDYAALGVLRGVFVGAMASLQIPAGLASEKLGAALVLGLGTALAGLGYCLAGASSGFTMLLGALFIGGIGASTQHPIASALVARAFAGPRSLKALGTYNFAGDIGKMTLPATLSLMLLALAWRPALAILGCLGFVLAAVIFVVTPRYGREGAAAAKVEMKTAADSLNVSSDEQGRFAFARVPRGTVQLIIRPVEQGPGDGRRSVVTPALILLPTNLGGACPHVPRRAALSQL